MTIPIYTNTRTTRRKTTKEFIEDAKLVHGDLFDYSEVKYKNNRTVVNLICKEHGSFPQIPANHLSGNGCPECAIIYKAENQRLKAVDEFIYKAKLIHGDKYGYLEVKYIKSSIPVDILCFEHGTFPQTPNNHLANHGCPECGVILQAEKKRSKAAKEFENKAKEVHGDLYSYSMVEYIGAKLNVNIICKEHGTFPQSPDNHLSSQGCPDCSKRYYSKVSIKWLNSINENIQHAENGGEYRIPNTRYSVDGYDPLINTVYEFHGDKFHGNLELFNPDDTPHPFNKDITAKELYEKTIKRENEIKDLGYNLVVMWESDYKKIN